jgi:hypothetical protein
MRRLQRAIDIDQWQTRGAGDRIEQHCACMLVTGKALKPMEVYPSDLSDQEWAILEPLIPPAKPRGRPRSVDMRLVLNGVFYVLRTGCAWRYLPREYPP